MAMLIEHLLWKEPCQAFTHLVLITGYDEASLFISFYGWVICKYLAAELKQRSPVYQGLLPTNLATYLVLRQRSQF